MIEKTILISTEIEDKAIKNLISLCIESKSLELIQKIRKMFIQTDNEIPMGYPEFLMKEFLKINWQTKLLADKYDYLAPDNSEIRLLLEIEGKNYSGGLCHCTLPAKTITKAVKHKNVGELWYFLEGEGQIWRMDEKEKVWRTVNIQPNMCISIPVGTHFQFRNTGNYPLRFLIATIPRWPGGDEAEKVQNHW